LKNENKKENRCGKKFKRVIFLKKRSMYLIPSSHRRESAEKRIIAKHNAIFSRQAICASIFFLYMLFPKNNKESNK